MLHLHRKDGFTLTATRLYNEFIFTFTHTHYFRSEFYSALNTTWSLAFFFLNVHTHYSHIRQQQHTHIEKNALFLLLYIPSSSSSTLFCYLVLAWLVGTTRGDITCKSCSRRSVKKIFLYNRKENPLSCSQTRKWYVRLCAFWGLSSLVTVGRSRRRFLFVIFFLSTILVKVSKYFGM